MTLDLDHTVRALLIGLLALGLAPYAHGQKWAIKGGGVEESNTMPGVVYVRFIDGRAPFGGVQSGFSSFDQLTTDLQVRSLTRAFPLVDAIAAKQPASESTRWLQGVYRLEYNAPIAPSSVAQWLSNSPEVDMVEPHYIYEIVGEVAPLASPNDPNYSGQAYLGRLELDDAWDTVKGDSGDVVIAIVDEGTSIAHEDLSGSLWVNSAETAGNNIDDDNNGYVDDINGWNFESSRADPTSVEGDAHGSWVSGAANAETDNSKGIAGAAWNAETMPLNAGCKGANGTVCHYINALLYAANNGADIVNCSWATTTKSAVLLQTIRTVLDSGALVVAAVGNDNKNIDHDFYFPARYPEVLSVGGTKNANNEKEAGSNYGRTVNVFAPGERVWVTNGVTTNKYGQGTGTSFAAPLVAGIAALVMTERPSLDPEQVRELIRLTANSIDSDNTSLTGLLGNGFPDADEALTATIPPALRLTDYKVTDANNDNIGQIGEEITVEATFTNYGGNASNINVGFSTAERYMDWNTSSATVATLNYGKSYTGTFSFDVANNTPVNYQTPLFTRITQGTFSDGPDALSLTLNYQAPYVTHSNSTTKFSVGRLGNIGHYHRRSDNRGSAGFQRNTPGGWEDFLFHGGLMLGTSSSNFADCLLNAGYTGYERDFANKSGTVQTLNSPGSVGSQDGLVTLVESSASGSSLNVEVAVNSYTFDASVDDDYVILHYEITNTGSSTLSGLHVGLYADFDATRASSGDKITFDSGRRAGYQQAASNSAETVGVRLLSDTGALNYEAVRVNSVVTDGFTDSEKWSRLSGGLGATSISGTDIGQVIGAGPIRISAGGTVDVAFALVHGGSASDFLTNSDAAQRKWHVINGDGIELSADVTTVSESDGATTVTVTAETADDSNLASAESYTITATGSGTTSAVDFGAISSFSIAVASGSSSGTGTFTLTPTNDSVDETNETITIGSSSPRVVEGTTITLTDDDATPSGIALTVSADTVDEGDGATTITVTGTVSGSTTFGASQDLPIRVTGSGTDGAVDFASVADFDLTVAAEGASGSATFTLTPTDDQTS